jgi:hypothetical protein
MKSPAVWIVSGGVGTSSRPSPLLDMKWRGERAEVLFDRSGGNQPGAADCPAVSYQAGRVTPPFLGDEVQSSEVVVRAPVVARLEVTKTSSSSGGAT